MILSERSILRTGVGRLKRVSGCLLRGPPRARLRPLGPQEIHIRQSAAERSEFRALASVLSSTRVEGNTLRPGKQWPGTTSADGSGSAATAVVTRVVTFGQSPSHVNMAGALTERAAQQDSGRKEGRGDGKQSPGKKERKARQGKGKERKGKERKGKERKGKEGRNGWEGRRNERKGKQSIPDSQTDRQQRRQQQQQPRPRPRPSSTRRKEEGNSRKTRQADVQRKEEGDGERKTERGEERRGEESEEGGTRKISHHRRRREQRERERRRTEGAGKQAQWSHLEAGVHIGARRLYTPFGHTRLGRKQGRPGSRDDWELEVWSIARLENVFVIYQPARTVVRGGPAPRSERAREREGAREGGREGRRRRRRKGRRRLRLIEVGRLGPAVR
ncbi:hypothetical protein Mp_1g12760 [Marchantia polymorpha subsp. ruderalis]|uniref:Uncharacterized protein n=2 Tax=Marchantia polymorpha TaxID=3197 RepID=A0AAF6APH3_MARPO|nr:hypothetical protein MARPO_0019s0046 [Marchantia polymorpha]BBM98343.1 hypothetical protein Mp_1g12760 [Marchantia polymorpha subsp. ruderalis]|eukprot:PTQ44610.1 hypothetical protein MARPO_0019s0046 [Marchantia polymorpha]